MNLLGIVHKINKKEGNIYSVNGIIINCNSKYLQEKKLFVSTFFIIDNFFNKNNNNLKNYQIDEYYFRIEIISKNIISVSKNFGDIIKLKNFEFFCNNNKFFAKNTKNSEWIIEDQFKIKKEILPIFIKNFLKKFYLDDLINLKKFQQNKDGLYDLVLMWTKIKKNFLLFKDKNNNEYYYKVNIKIALKLNNIFLFKDVFINKIKNKFYLSLTEKTSILYLPSYSKIYKDLLNKNNLKNINNNGLIFSFNYKDFMNKNGKIEKSKNNENILINKNYSSFLKINANEILNNIENNISYDKYYWINGKVKSIYPNKFENWFKKFNSKTKQIFDWFSKCEYDKIIFNFCIDFVDETLSNNNKLNWYYSSSTFEETFILWNIIPQMNNIKEWENWKIKNIVKFNKKFKTILNNLINNNNKLVIKLEKMKNNKNYLKLDKIIFI